ncbi:putative DNA (cytosine-5)-methyltransferase CMT1 [Rhododendron vialii]|uniref:putative DNA (cytosine-5)-methyltransferase CMT1 n=1 Tax=Rhododendron vialii TaxID=182163 RepID=UPI00265E10B0|nr:putative DNA (cytosine-5)-methyltransferase CMT1 [Rhododendron vialii]
MPPSLRNPMKIRKKTAPGSSESRFPTMKPGVGGLVGTQGRYIQVGNAAAVPVSRVLGYALALAPQGLSGEEPVFALPETFPRLQIDSLPAVEDFV